MQMLKASMRTCVCLLLGIFYGLPMYAADAKDPAETIAEGICNCGEELRTMQQYLEERPLEAIPLLSTTSKCFKRTSKALAKLEGIDREEVLTRVEELVRADCPEVASFFFYDPVEALSKKVCACGEPLVEALDYRITAREKYSEVYAEAISCLEETLNTLRDNDWTEEEAEKYLNALDEKLNVRCPEVLEVFEQTPVADPVELDAIVNDVVDAFCSCGTTLIELDAAGQASDDNPESVEAAACLQKAVSRLETIVSKEERARVELRIETEFERRCPETFKAFQK